MKEVVSSDKCKALVLQEASISRKEKRKEPRSFKAKDEDKVLMTLSISRRWLFTYYIINIDSEKEDMRRISSDKKRDISFRIHENQFEESAQKFAKPCTRCSFQALKRLMQPTNIPLENLELRTQFAASGTLFLEGLPIERHWKHLTTLLTNCVWLQCLEQDDFWQALSLD